MAIFKFYSVSGAAAPADSHLTSTRPISNDLAWWHWDHY